MVLCTWISTTDGSGRPRPESCIASSGSPWGSVGLFGITGNGGTGAVQSYKLGSVSLTTAGLSFTPNTTVPLPAAVWLLGSGLLGLFGVSRRRAA